MLWQTGRRYFQRLPPCASRQKQAFLAKMSRATFQTHIVMYWCTQKNSRIVWSRLCLPFLDPTKTLRSCAVWGLVRKVHHSHGAGSRLLLEVRKQCWWAPVGQVMQRAESTHTQTTHSSTCLANKRSETSSFEPCYSFGPQQGSKSLGPKGRGPEWPSGSV